MDSKFGIQFKQYSFKQTLHNLINLMGYFNLQFEQELIADLILLSIKNTLILVIKISIKKLNI